MKILTTIMIFISSICLSQNYTYFNTFDKNEVYNTQTMKWRQDTTAWYVFFEKDMGLILFQDTLSKDWFSFKIVEQGTKDREKYNYSYRCVDNTKKEAYLYFYRDEKYSIIKVEYPYLTIKYKSLLKDY